MSQIHIRVRKDHFYLSICHKFESGFEGPLLCGIFMPSDYHRPTIALPSRQLGLATPQKKGSVMIQKV